MNNTKYVSKNAASIMTEIVRRLNVFHNGNLDESLLLLTTKSQVRHIKEYNLVKPYSIEVSRSKNWYNLTKKGKEYFKNYIMPINQEKNFKMFTGQIILDFKKPS